MVKKIVLTSVRPVLLQTVAFLLAMMLVSPWAVANPRVGQFRDVFATERGIASACYILDQPPEAYYEAFKQSFTMWMNELPDEEQLMTLSQQGYRTNMLYCQVHQGQDINAEDLTFLEEVFRNPAAPEPMRSIAFTMLFVFSPEERLPDLLDQAIQWIPQSTLWFFSVYSSPIYVDLIVAQIATTYASHAIDGSNHRADDQQSWVLNHLFQVCYTLIAQEMDPVSRKSSLYALGALLYVNGHVYGPTEILYGRPGDLHRDAEPVSTRNNVVGYYRFLLDVGFPDDAYAFVYGYLIQMWLNPSNKSPRRSLSSAETQEIMDLLNRTESMMVETFKSILDQQTQP